MTKCFGSYSNSRGADEIKGLPISINAVIIAFFDHYHKKTHTFLVELGPVYMKARVKKQIGRDNKRH